MGNNAKPDFASEFQQSINPAQAEFDRLVRLRLYQAEARQGKQDAGARFQPAERTQKTVAHVLARS